MTAGLQPHASLAALNTLGLPGSARWLATVSSVAELQDLLRDARFAGLPRRVLGGGSNIVPAGGEVQALVLQLAMRNWRVLSREGSRALVEAEAGLPWHELVTACVDAGLGGIENLALIPGSTGAAPVQNIGAYGVELASVLVDVDVVDLRDGARRRIARDGCALGYRDSLFKRHPELAIVSLRLQLDAEAPLQTAYRDLQEELAARGNPVPDHRLVYDMVCAIRRRKLPDPAVTGNAGSFFKNPVVDAAAFAALQQRFPDIAAWPQADGRVKLAAAWLIDRAGWKGFRDGAVGVHDRQALVLVNHGGGTGAQLLALAARIIADVRARYGVVLEMEPQVWD